MSWCFSRLSGLAYIWLLQITFSQTSNITCDYGYFGTSYKTNSTNYGKCVFNCYQYAYNGDSSYSEILPSNLTFDFILDHCYTLQYAITHSPNANNCSSLDDLIWSNAYCSCPYCRCFEPVGTRSASNITTYFAKQCVECQCDIRNGNNETGYDCNQRYGVDNVLEWDEYTCSNIVTCTDSVSGQTYYPGDGYWLNSVFVTGPHCQTYCYCNFDGTLQCEKTYYNILNSANTALTNQFKEDCEWEAVGCFDDVTLMFYNYSYCDCPRCNCPANVSAVFYQEYTRTASTSFGEGSYYNTTCMKCQCVDYGNGLQQQCDAWGDGDDYKKGTDTCPQTMQGTCLYGESSTMFQTDANNGSGLQSTQCYGNANQHCGWTYEPYEYPEYEWSCQHSVSCEVFGDGRNESCFHLSVDVPISESCYNDNSFTIDQYMMCCQGNNCNNKDANISTCIEDAFVNQWYADWIACQYGDAYQAFFCSEVEEYTCADIRQIGTWRFGCTCTAYQAIFNRTTSQWQQWLIDDMSMLLTQLDDWNDFFNCSFHFSCDLNSTGLIGVNGIVQSPKPTAAPTISPTLAITISTTISHTIIPTNGPTELPTNGATVLPTDTPTVLPTDTPTSPTGQTTKIPSNSQAPTNPTKIPTLTPTQSPTFCYNAKYQYIMYGIRKDYLSSDELLVSLNCQYRVQLNKNGNLILYDADNDEIWMTNTQIFNYSGQSFPRFVIELGVIKIIEYQYKNVPALKTSEIWTSDKVSTIGGNNIVLILTDYGCLILKVMQEIDDNYIWREGECDETQSTTDTIITRISTSDDSNDKDPLTVSNINRNNLWWLWLLIVLIIVLIFIAFVWFRKYGDNSMNNKTWITSSINYNNEYENDSQDSDDADDQFATQQINTWIKETQMEVLATEGNNNMALIGDAEIVSAMHMVQTPDFID